MANAMSNVANANLPSANGLVPDPVGIGYHMAAEATFPKSRLGN